MKEIGLDLLSKKRKGIFDDFFISIENKRLESYQNDKEFDLIEKALLIVERDIQDFEQEKDERYKIIIYNITNVLENIHTFFKEDIAINKEDIAYAILGIKNVIFHAVKKNLRKNSIKSLFDSIFPHLNKLNKKEVMDKEEIRNKSIMTHVRLIDKKLKELRDKLFEELKDEKLRVKKLIELQELRDREFKKIQEARKENFGWNESFMKNELRKKELMKLKSNLVFGNLQLDYLSSNSIDDYLKNVKFTTLYKIDETDEVDEINKADEANEIDKINYWDIKITFSENNISASEVTQLLWILTNSLEQIDDVEVLLEDWGRGSFWARLKIKIAGWVAKEELKDIADKARQAAEAQYLNKPIEESRKIEAERLKIEKETKLIPGDSILEQKHLLELEQSKLELKLKKIEMLNKLSDLMAKGFVDVNSDFQIEINGLLFIEKKDNKLIVGEDMDSIDNASLKLDKEKEGN